MDSDTVWTIYTHTYIGNSEHNMLDMHDLDMHDPCSPTFTVKSLIRMRNSKSRVLINCVDIFYRVLMSTFC